MTTMSASRPPDTFTNRSRMWRSFSLFSAPPIGMIQPRVPPSGTMLGNVLLLAILERTPPDGLAVPDVDFPTNNDRMRAACRVQCNEIGVGAGFDPALAGEPQQAGRIGR